jgi:hypothetical protein
MKAAGRTEGAGGPDWEPVREYDKKHGITHGSAAAATSEPAEKAAAEVSEGGEQ